MISANVRTRSGFDDFRDRIVPEGIGVGLDQAAILVAGTVGDQLNKSGPGPASKPGSPPAKQTGALGASFDNMTARQTRTRNPLVRQIGVVANVFYGAIHERGLGRFPKRPFLLPGFNRARPRLQAAFTNAARKKIRSQVIRLLEGGE